MEIYNVKLLRQDPVESFVGFGNRECKKVKLCLSNGLDRFVGDAYDYLAEEIEKNPLDYHASYNVQFEMAIRDKKDDKTGDVRKFNSIKITKICVG